ncbi:hypothetical protein PHYSODRAFT_255336 [Phytophthora sojae]|uniref:Protein kinase domain-containing protein n=1 Tax=Phytophthora sojae (strain P6497) TaxID=1094619 RepID=G4ZA31_PHYSP|nr:hypothetical protein PHYSODRAFT_255336 [Phytophthora sojae]EGZ21170.1 hypothetical protein PHYSODRAFT_255336 [Phytophthora sojae]|eukprot:XP_009523887.1 hypothetical protein PHYSODRAFT_255336 [Phytophthora sojae]
MNSAPISTAQDVAALQALSPKPHQFMFTSLLKWALALGHLLQSALPPQDPQQQQQHQNEPKRGLFRRNSTSSSKKKPKKERKKPSKAKSETFRGGAMEAAILLFHRVVEGCQHFVTTFGKTHKFVFHLASMRRMYLDLEALGAKLDKVVTLAELQEKVELERQQGKEQGWTWRKQLDEDREKEEAELSARAAKNALPFARNMLPHEPMEALTLLKFEIDHFKAENSTRHVASMKKVFFSVVRSSNGRVAKIPEWYIPPYAVNYSREKVMEGSVGTAHRGVWVDRKSVQKKTPEKDSGHVEQPKTHKVMVKRYVIHADAIETFKQEVEAWFAMEHANIIKLYGASHCSRPALLVLEDATNGSLVSYLTRQRQFQAGKRREKRTRGEGVNTQWPYRNQRHALWSLFLEAAEGLRYLHEEIKLVHSNLKSDNILVTGDSRVKLTDFGLGVLALQDQAVQDKKFQELGWRAPNCVQKKPFRRPSFQDDVYSFGLCVLDVLVPEFSSIKPDTRQGAPKHVGDKGFNPLSRDVLALIDNESHKKLVQDMCQENPGKRLSLKDVISRMEEIRDAAAKEPADSSECCIL